MAALAIAACGGALAQPAPPTAPTVVVSATRHALLEIEAPAAFTVVTRRDLEARGADNLLDGLRGEVSLSMQGRAVGGRKVLALRGLDSRHTLFLVDGRRIGASDGAIGASDFQYDWIAVDDIERIEVVRGPMSVLYGAEALGGVVNVITRDPGDRWRGSALVEGSRAHGGRGGDGERAQASADGPLAPGWFVRAGAAHTRVAALASPVDPRISELEGKRKDDGWIGLSWRPGTEQRVDLEHRAGTEQRDADARERGGRRRYHHTVNDIERTLSSASWEAGWGGTMRSQLRAYRSMIDVVNTRTEGVAVNLPQRLVEQVAEGQLSNQAGPLRWMAGTELRNESLADPGLPGGRSLARHRALFVQGEARLATALDLTAGLRYDDHSLFGPQWSPRAYLVWQAGGGLTFKGGAGHGFKAPNLKQIVPGARTEGPNTFLGNPGLRPERSDALEATAAWAGGGAQLALTAFAQRVQDLIDVRLVAASPTPGVGTYTYENLSRARLRGLEAQAARPLGAGLTASANYTYLDATDGLGHRLERRPRHSATLRLAWERGPWRAGFSAEHSGRQLLPSTIVGAPAQSVPAVTLTAAQIAYGLPGGIEASLAVSNLGNVSLARKSPLFTQVEAPRTWRVALRGRW